MSCFRSPRRRLSDLMSPSELLENPLEFDDIDQALNEDGKLSNVDRTESTDFCVAVEEPVSLRPVQCPQEHLDKLLHLAVDVTDGCTVQTLLDLYNQLSRIVKKFSNAHHRTDLPKVGQSRTWCTLYIWCFQELETELNRFKCETSPETVSEQNPSSNRSS
jgi:hypothetical protein